MKLTIAKSAGYCFGVKRAVNMVYQEAEEAKVPVYTYGPIIHNEEVVRDLKQRGVHVVRELKELENLPKGKIIIRSHGISRREHEAMKACGFEVLDATCPFVLKIHRLVEKYSKEGYVLDGETREVDLTYRDQNTAVVTYSADWQNKRQRAEVNVLKKVKDSDRVLEGAVFALCNKEDIVNAKGDVILKADTVIEEQATDNTESKHPVFRSGPDCSLSQGNRLFLHRRVLRWHRYLLHEAPVLRSAWSLRARTACSVFLRIPDLHYRAHHRF